MKTVMLLIFGQVKCWVNNKRMNGVAFLRGRPKRVGLLLKKIYHTIVVFCILSLMNGCKHQKFVPDDSPNLLTKEGIEFFYNENYRIVVNAQLFAENDESLVKDTIQTKEGRFIFDTGGGGLLIIKDSIANSVYPKWKQKGTKASLFSGWEALEEYHYIKVNEPVYLHLNKDSVLYKEFYVYSKSSVLSDSDGLFSIPAYNEKVWELNFDCNRLILKDSSSFIGADKVISLEMKDTLELLKAIDFPFEFISENRDTIKFKEDLIIDTGVDTPLSYKYIDFIGNKDSLCKKYELPYAVRYNLNFFLVNYYYPLTHKVWVKTIVSQMPYKITHDISMVAAGIDFLKFFNIEIDRKNSKFHFVPIRRPYLTTYTEICKRNSEIVFRAFRDLNNDAIVYEADSNAYNYKGDYLRVGDVIIDVDGEKLHRRPYTYFETIEQDSKIKAIRGKDTITITIAKPNKTTDSLRIK